MASQQVTASLTPAGVEHVYGEQKFGAGLLDLEPALWTFVRDEGVEPTNNAAERAVRPSVLWRRRSFGCHSANGCRFVERILTVVPTLRLLKRPVFAFLADAVAAYRRDRLPHDY